jgi:alginate O-acetyltransferase complex protein AlgJ
MTIQERFTAMHKNNNVQNYYAHIFSMAVIGVFVFIMMSSIEGGFKLFEENFYQKKSLIALFNTLKYSLGDHVFPQVLVGQDGFLHFTSDENLDDFQNADLNKKAIKNVYNQINTLNEILKAQGITLVVVVAPNKETIYSDKLPLAIQKLKPQSRLDEFIQMFQGTDTPLVTDLRPALLLAKQTHLIYSKTDTHWNFYGAYFAYREIMNRIAQVDPEVHPYEFNDFTFTEGAPRQMDLAKLMGVDFITEPSLAVTLNGRPDMYFQDFRPSVVSMSWAEEGQDRKLLFYHDSFGYVIRRFFQYNFKESVYIYSEGYTCQATRSWIHAFKPDVVIIEIVERDLAKLDGLVSNLICETTR